MALLERSLDEGQAEDVTVIDLAGKTTIADYMVIASGRSQRHIVTLAERLVEALKRHGLRKVPVEGTRHGEWVLVDAGDVIVHIFRPELRRVYNLEKMWGIALPEPERTELSA
ncbi:MAG: ribosome silencing factor [Alphaproteobacteria bacterium]